MCVSMRSSVAVFGGAQGCWGNELFKGACAKNQKKGCPAFCISMPNRTILFCTLQGKEICFYDGKAAGETGSERKLKIFTEMVCG